jgi:enamine deaminase RidA (YjgF/YER057c/UK114 family)
MARHNISSGSPFEPRYGFSRAVRSDDRLEIMLGALSEAGGVAADVVRTRMFITNAAHADAVGEAHGEVFAEIRPASTMVVVGGLLDPRWHVEMELEAVLTQ